MSIPATADMSLTYVDKSIDGTGKGNIPLVRCSSDGTNWYGWGITISGGYYYGLPYKSAGGSISGLGGSSSTGVAYSAGQAVHVKASAIGTTIGLKIWIDGTSEPASPQLTVTDSSVSAAGYAGVYYSGNSSGYAVDNLAVYGNSSLTAGTLSSSGIGSTTATITSTGASGGAGSYTQQLYRSTNPNFVPDTATLISGATSNTLNDTGLAPSTSYTYIQVATDSAGAIVWSSTITITTGSSSASNFTLTPSSQTTTAGAATGNYTVTPNGAPYSSTTVALSDGGAGGTFTPSSLTFTTATAQTFTYTPAGSDRSETVTLTATASGGFSATHTANCVVTSTAATGFALTPSNLNTTPSTATGNYTVTLNGTLSANETIALADGGAGGTFTPSSLTFTSANAGTPQTFIYTPASGTAGDSITLTAMGIGQFSASHTATCSVSTPITAGTAYATYTGVKTVQLAATQATGGGGTYTCQWYRSTSSGSHGTALSGATAESVIDTTAAADTTYYYSLAYSDGTSTVYSAQVSVTTKAATLYEVVGGIGDSIEAGSYSMIQTPFAAMIDQLNFGMPSREWYGGAPASGTSGGASVALDLAISGTTTTSWLPAGSNLPGAAATLAAAGCTRVVINLAANDAEAGTTASTYESNLSSIIAYLFAHVSTLQSVHLVGPMFQGEASGSYSVQNSGLLIAYDGVMAALANGSTIYHTNALAPFAYFQRRGTVLQRSADLLHPNDYGDQATGGLWATDVISALNSTTTTTAAGLRRVGFSGGFQ